jgi:predicted amino acid racemase
MPVLLVDVDAIGRNTEVVGSLLRAPGIDLIGVTKGCLGEPRVGEAMLSGGAIALADTRDANLRRLRGALPRAELHRIHLPSLGEEFDPGDVTYVSSLAGARAVAALAGDGSREPRRVMLQVETGDLREGVPDRLLEELAQAVAGDCRLRLLGLSTNYACFEGTSEGIRASVDAIAGAARRLRRAGMSVERVSGGNSSVLALLDRGEMVPSEVTELRCGEALLLGQEALLHRPLPGCTQTACVLRAEVLEGYTKPVREGERRRLVLGIGRQDLGSGSVRFLDAGLRELGRSADYVVVEQDGGDRRVDVGDMVHMIPSYEALVAAWTSPYVELRLR